MAMLGDWFSRSRHRNIAFCMFWFVAVTRLTLSTLCFHSSWYEREHLLKVTDETINKAAPVPGQRFPKRFSSWQDQYAGKCLQLQVSLRNPVSLLDFQPFLKHIFLFASSISSFFCLVSLIHLQTTKASGCVHLELIDKALSNIQRLVWIP